MSDEMSNLKDKGTVRLTVRQVGEGILNIEFTHVETGKAFGTYDDIEYISEAEAKKYGGGYITQKGFPVEAIIKNLKMISVNSNEELKESKELNKAPEYDGH